MITPQPTPQEREMVLAARILNTVSRDALVKVLINMAARVIPSMVDASDMTMDEFDAMVFRTAAALVMEEDGQLTLTPEAVQ